MSKRLLTLSTAEESQLKQNAVIRQLVENSNDNTREKLTANRTYYFDTASGNDANDGLALATAFKTLQGGYNAIVNAIDFGGYQVNLQLKAAQTYGNLSINGTTSATSGPAWTGGGNLAILGNTYVAADATQTTVILDNGGTADNIAVTAPLPGQITLQYLKIQNTGGFAGVNLAAAGLVAITNCVWDNFANGSNHMNASGSGAKIEEFGGNSINHNYGSHYVAQFQAYVLGQDTITWTLAGATSQAGLVKIADMGIVQLNASSGHAWTPTGFGAIGGFQYVIASAGLLESGGRAGTTPGSGIIPGTAMQNNGGFVT